MTAFTDGDLIAHHTDLKNYIEAEDVAHKERMKPYREALKVIAGTMGERLIAAGAQNVSTDHGTAYLRHDDGIKVDNEPLFLQFVRSVNAWNMTKVTCLVDPVRTYLNLKAPPPAGKETFAEELARLRPFLPDGVSFNPEISCIIRR